MDMLQMMGCLCAKYICIVNLHVVFSEYFIGSIECTWNNRQSHNNMIICLFDVGSDRFVC